MAADSMRDWAQAMWLPRSLAATAAAVAFCTACTVLCRSVGDDAALTGVAPTTAPTDSTSPHVTTPMEVSLFRLMVLLLLCRGMDTPATAACVIPSETSTF